MKNKSSLMGNQRGVSMVMVAILLIAFIAVLAIVIDLGHLHAVRQELQNAAEAGALAGTRALFEGVGEGTPIAGLDPATYPQCSNATDKAGKAAKLNFTDINKQVTLLGSDIQLMSWDWGTNKPNSSYSCTMTAP